VYDRFLEAGQPHRDGNQDHLKKAHAPSIRCQSSLHSTLKLESPSSNTRDVSTTVNGRDRLVFRRLIAIKPVLSHDR
jgi:hypothetical protein